MIGMKALLSLFTEDLFILKNRHCSKKNGHEFFTHGIKDTRYF